MEYFSLFSGIGGFELGIQNVSQAEGVQQGRYHKDLSNPQRPQLSPKPFCVGFSEINKYATTIYKKHFPNHKKYGNVSNIKWSNVPDFELLCGGFPCQSFSIAGKRGGFSDTRGTLFFEIVRVAQEKQPRLLFLENVKGLLSHDKGRTFGTILNTLDELGYDLQWQVLNSKNFGVPQNRERVFIIGHLRTTPRPQVFPLRQDGKISTEQGKVQVRDIESPKRVQDSHFSILENGKNRPLRIRRLTPTECERLQGFPDGWTAGISDTQRYKCLGNAVTVNVISAITEKLLDFPRRKC